MLIGIRKTVFLLGKYAPPKIASAKIGVKLGRCGTSLVKDTRKIIDAINNILICITLHINQKRTKIKPVFFKVSGNNLGGIYGISGSC